MLRKIIDINAFLASLTENTDMYTVWLKQNGKEFVKAASERFKSAITHKFLKLIPPNNGGQQLQKTLCCKKKGVGVVK